MEGNKACSSEQILRVAGLKVGQMISRKGFEEARQRLVDSGHFRNVGYHYQPDLDEKGYRATYQVDEEQEIYPVGFDSLPATAAEMTAALKASDPLFGERVPATPPLVARYVEALTAFLAGKGYHEKIAGGLAAESTPDLVLLFHPAIRPSVAQVIFEGNKAISETDLQNAIGGVAVGTVYIEPRFRAYLDNGIRPLFETKGYVRVAFPKITTEKAADVNGLVVHVQVVEGPVYKLAGVTAANPELLRIAKLAGVKSNETADFSKIKAAEDRIEKNWRHQGYMHARASDERQVDDKTRTVKVALSVEAGPQYKFRELNIQGLDIISEPVIRKMWGLKEGMPFNPDYPQHFLDVVKEEGVLENLGKTEAKPKIDDDTRLVDVTLVFNGAPPKPPWKPGQRPQQTPEYPGQPPI